LLNPVIAEPGKWRTHEALHKWRWTLTGAIRYKEYEVIEAGLTRLFLRIGSNCYE